jgi:hypothetical protein
MEDKELKEGEDYYFDPDGLLVFTADYLKTRGYCCENGCRHCPYGFLESKATPSTSGKD